MTIDGEARRGRGAKTTLACLVMGLACAGEVSTDPDEEAVGGSANAAGGRSGAAGRGGRGGSAGAAGRGGSAGSAMVDAGAAGAGGTSMQGAGAAPELPADCPQIEAIPVPGQAIVIQSMNFDTSEVVLKNVSNTTQTILGQRTGWQWCNFPAYWAISEAGDVELSPGETFAFIAIYNTTGAREFDPEGGEMGIYTATGSFTTPELMRSFVSWGDVIPQREATASMGGYWVYGDRIAIEPGDDGFVIVGESDRASGYQSVRAACLVAPPNE